MELQRSPALYIELEIKFCDHNYTTLMRASFKLMRAMIELKLLCAIKWYGAHQFNWWKQ